MATFTQLTSTNPKTVTSATAETGVSIASLPAANFGWMTVQLQLLGLDSGDTARISIDVSGDGGTTWNTLWIFPSPGGTFTGPYGVTGELGEEGDDEGESTGFPCNPFQIGFSPARNGCTVGTPSGSGVIGEGLVTVVPWGISGGLIRVNVFSLTGSSPHLTYNCYFTY